MSTPPSTNTNKPQASFTFQVRLLLSKNIYMLKRNSSSTVLQVGVGVFFLLLLYLINAGLNSNTMSTSLLSQANDLPPMELSPMELCRPADAVGSPAAVDGSCYAFAFAPYESDPTKRDATTELTHSVVDLITKANANLPLPTVGTKRGPLGFINETSMLEWLLERENQGRVTVAVRVVVYSFVVVVFIYSFFFNFINSAVCLFQVVTLWNTQSYIISFPPPLSSR